jgi:hypothetical protein
MNVGPLAENWNSPEWRRACYPKIVQTNKRTRSLFSSPWSAARTGDALPGSPLLQKVFQLSGCDEAEVREWLLKCAVGRGASHYAREFGVGLPPDDPQMSDEELGVALCGHPYNPTYIRGAAQLLSSPRTDTAKLARLAVLEGVEPVLVHIAKIAARYAPAAEPWSYLLRNLPQSQDVPSDSLPHWSRFVSQTGVTPFGGGPSIKWLCRRGPAA